MSNALTNAINNGDVQKPTLTEVSKIFKPTKKDLITVAKHVLAESRGRLSAELARKSESLRKDRQAIRDEISKVVHKELDKVTSKYKRLETRLRKLVPGITVTCSHCGDNPSVNIGVSYCESITSDIPQKLQEKLQVIDAEICKIDAARNSHPMSRTSAAYIDDSEVLSILVTQRMQDSGQLKALLDELTEAIQQDVRKSVGLASDRLQVTVEK